MMDYISENDLVKPYQTSAELGCKQRENDAGIYSDDKYDNSQRWLCNWLHCVFGMGIAGMGRCPGNPYIKDCSEFMTEDQAMCLWWPEEFSENSAVI